MGSYRCHLSTSAGQNPSAVPVAAGLGPSTGHGDLLLEPQGPFSSGRLLFTNVDSASPSHGAAARAEPPAEVGASCCYVIVDVGEGAAGRGTTRGEEDIMRPAWGEEVIMRPSEEIRPMYDSFHGLTHLHRSFSMEPAMLQASCRVS